MDELLAKVLVDGGTLAVFIVLVIYLNKVQSEERKIYLGTLKEQLVTKHDGEQGNMALGLASLDKVNGNIHELVAVNIELSKAMAVHDVGDKAAQSQMLSGMSVVISKLDNIRDRMMVGAKDG